MKKIFLAIAAFTAAFSFVSCSVDELDNDLMSNGNEGSFIITAYSESGPASKAGISGNDAQGYDVIWEKGDDIYAYAPMAGLDYTTGRIGVSGGVGTTTAAFAAKNPLDPTAFIWSPASLGEKYGSYDVQYLSWPAVQKYSADCMISGIPMYCTDVETTADSQKLQFKNLGGLLRFTIRGTEDMVLTGIELSSTSPLAGEFSISSTDYPAAVLKTSEYSSEPTNTIRLEVPSVSLDTNGKDFYMALVPGSYDGVQVKLLFSDRDPVIKHLNRALVINRAEITPASMALPAPGVFKGLVGTPEILSKVKIYKSIINKIATGLGYPEVGVELVFGEALDKIIPNRNVYQAKIEYYTPAPDGSLVVASGVIAWTEDVNSSKTYGRIISVQHGTCDIDKAPSKLDFSVELAPVFQNNGNGYDNVVVLADFLGYGSSRTPDLQTPYMHAYYSASPCADMLRAAETFLQIEKNFSYKKENAETEPIALCGYSQGGQATMATLFELQDRGYTSRIVDVKAGAGPHNLVSFLDHYKKLQGKEYKTTGYLPYMVRGLLYGENSDLPLNELLAPEVFAENAQGVIMANQFSSTMLSTWHEGLGYDITKVLHPDFFKDDGQRSKTVDAFIEMARSNSVINMGMPDNPSVVTLYHGEYDDQVPYACSEAAKDKWGCQLVNLTIEDNHFLGAIEFYIKYIGEKAWEIAEDVLDDFVTSPVPEEPATE